MAVLNFNDNLERELFEGGYLVSEIAGMLEYGDPNAHSVSLNDAIKLVDVETIINVFLEPSDVLDSSVLNPIMKFKIEPTIVFQHFEPSFTSQEFRDENVDIVRVHERGILLVVRLRDVSSGKLVLIQVELVITFIV